MAVSSRHSCRAFRCPTGAARMRLKLGSTANHAAMMALTRKPSNVHSPSLGKPGPEREDCSVDEGEDSWFRHNTSAQILLTMCTCCRQTRSRSRRLIGNRRVRRSARTVYSKERFSSASMAVLLDIFKALGGRARSAWSSKTARQHAPAPEVTNPEYTSFCVLMPLPV